MLALILFFALIGGVASLIGGMVLLFKRNLSPALILGLISFAAGVLLAVSFADLLPEAINQAMKLAIPPASVLSWTLAAMVSFFLFERSFIWFHHHHGPHPYQPSPVLTMVWLSDTLHNFLDGIVITTSFLISVPLGIATSLAVAAHELPQEIADFSLFLAKGVSRTKTLWLNLLSSLATLLGSLGMWFFAASFRQWQPQLLGFTAGMFIYIAASDLLPELHQEHQRRHIWLHTLAFLFGITLTFWLKTFLD